MDKRKYIPAVNPEPGQPDLRLIYFQPRVAHVKKLGALGAIKEAAELVPYTLKYPCAMFEGLRPPDDDHSGNSPGWLCYCSRPALKFKRSGEECNSDTDQVFLVFVNEDLIIFNWRWEYADVESLGSKQYLPVNYKTRFRKQLK